MDLQSVQQEVDAWVSQFESGYWPPLANLARLTEEVGELARELNHAYGAKPKKAEEQAGDIALELGDILFVVAALANSLQIDLSQAFVAVLEKYRRRDSERWARKGGE